MIRIALDAMGGDHAPRVCIEGSQLALEQFEDLHLDLVGPADIIEKECAEMGITPSDRLEIVHAPEYIEMHESPVEALRKKRESSLRVMTSRLKEGQCDAIFSAGNTGAVVAASTMLLGLLPGVRRAGIAVALPVERPVVLIDVGANVTCKPHHLLQYAVMASEFSSRVYGIENPSVGLLNIGEEEAKGNALAKETHDLFRNANLNYRGNVEGRDIFHSDCSVVVCDGFVGNIVLKTAEGLWEKLNEILVHEVMSGGGDALKQVLGRMKKRLDYNNYGGAPLLGAKGTVIIGHGRSDAKAVASAVRWAREMVVARVNDYIVESVAAVSTE